MSTEYAKSALTMDRAQRAWLLKIGAALKTQIDVTDAEDIPLTGVYGEGRGKKQSAGYEAESMLSKTEYGQHTKQEKEIARKTVMPSDNYDADKKRKPVDRGHGGSGGEGDAYTGKEEYAENQSKGPSYPASGPMPEPTPEPTPAPYPATAECAKYSNEVLRAGAKGPAVECLQKMLGGIDVDGKYGPGTQKAVQAWQKNHGLTADGVVGPKTWAALSGAPAGPAGYGDPPAEPGKPGYPPTKPGKPGYAPQKPGKPNYSPSPPGGGGYSPTPPKKPGYPPTKPGKPGYPPYKPGQPEYSPSPPDGGGYSPNPPTKPGYPPTKPGKPGYYPAKPGEPDYKQPEPCPPGHTTPDSYTPPRVVEDVSQDSGEKGVVQKLKDKAEEAKKRIEGIFD